ncbi:MAG: hypothetical protein PHC61_18900, partial [Chitinivibrionales bacterium]|nr:hypothetical protein [Chitinivibrionales bacterium]
AHNGILFNDLGFASGEYVLGVPVVTRLESRTAYAYAVDDLSKAYIANDPNHPDRENPYASKCIREYLFIRPFETLFILDRLESTAANVIKSFLLHVPGTPVISGDQVTYTNGANVLYCTGLTAGHTFKIVDEGGGISRIQDDIGGATQTMFMHLIQTGATGVDKVEARVVDNTNGWTITLTSASKGSAVITMNKGLTSTGGTFGYAATGIPAASALSDTVQKMTVTDNGPVWAGGAMGITQQAGDSTNKTNHNIRIVNHAGQLTAIIEGNPFPLTSGSMKLVDLKGCSVRAFTQEKPGAANTRFVTSGTGISAGIYFVRYRAGTIQEEVPFILLK